MAEAGQRLGQLLMRAGIITERQLNDALEVHKATGSPLGRVLVDLGYAKPGRHPLGHGAADRHRRTSTSPSDDPTPTPSRSCRKDLAEPLHAHADRGSTSRAGSSSRWPIRRTCSRSTTCASSPATRSSRRSRPRTTSSRRSRSTTRSPSTSPTTSSIGDDDWHPTSSTQLTEVADEAPDRQARQLHHQEGRRRPRVRHPHRAAGEATSASGSASTACSTR